MRSVEKRLCWIFGSPRSGSTWLLKMLAEHERIAPVNEPQIGLHLAPFVSDWPGWDASALGDRFSFNRVAEDFQIYFFSRRHEKRWLPLLGRMICGRIAVYGDRRSIFAIKEPNGSQAADVILRALPRSRLLFLLRDGRDVVDSELAGALRGSWMSKWKSPYIGVGDADRADFLAQAARKWVWRTQVVQEAFASHTGPKLLIRYEELLADTERELARVLDWLKLPPDSLVASVERHRFEQTAERGAGQFVRSASPGAWRENLSSEEKQVVERIMGEKLRQVGYA